MTFSEENYLKAIYHLSKDNEQQGVSTNAIAQKMNTKASSVTDMIKRLSEKQLVDYIKYQGVRLTKKGTDLAVNLVRKHRLWEVFLVNVLDFSWDEVHEVAEQLEHIKSKKLIEQLDAFLGYPDFDPHGDPIPDKHGHIADRKKSLLSEIPVGKNCICIGVKNTSKDFLQYLDKKNIALGDEIQILDKEPFDASIMILHKGKEVNISSLISHNIYVK